MSSEQLFANGRIAVLSNKLLTADKYMRLCECASVTEALKVLSECGYASVTESANYEQALRVELDKTITEIKELCTGANALRFLLCKYDYHNAKVLMKGKYMREDFTSYCYESATYAPDSMRDSINEDEYKMFSANMAEACDAIDAEFANGNRSPQVIDRLLDKAYFEDLRRFARLTSSPLIAKLLNLQINYANLTLLSRMKNMAYSEQDFKMWLVEGGSIKPKTLLKLFNGELSQTDLPSEWRGFLSGKNTEKYFFSMRASIIAQYADPLTLQPALQYFYAKVEETEHIRRIIADIKNGVDKEKIKDNFNA